MKILCIEDDAGLLYLLQSALEQAQMQFMGVSSGDAGLELLNKETFDAIVVDQQMPGLTGLEVIRTIIESKIEAPIIMVTGEGNEDVAVEAIRSGASDYLVKDANLAYLKILPSVILQVINQRDLTLAREAAERNLQLEKDRSTLLSQFIQNASHEFFTPLSVITTSTDLLQHYVDQPKPLQHVYRIKEQSEIIQHLVGDLVKLAGLDMQSSLEVESVNMNRLIQDVCSRFDELVTKNELNFILEVPDNPIVTLARIPDLFDALTELIDNACRYSQANDTVRVELGTSDGKVIIRIQDTGIGISEEHHVHIFERFYRVDKAQSTRGLGLGLSIASRIIELHHGEIKVESELDKGTTMIVILPGKT